MSQKTCKICLQTFEIPPADLDFYRKFGFEPLPICLECQHRRRLIFRNERRIYRRKCDFSREEIISIYPPGAPYKVYRTDVWYSDLWDPLSYGQDFDFNRTFTEQFAELQKEVPRMALSNVNAVNSDYCNMTYGNKNCYLLFGSDYNEDCLYGTLSMHSRNFVDCDYCNYCELCYECSDLERCYNCQFAFNSRGCSDCFYINDCFGCHDCILCFNLRNKAYYIENKPYSKEEYFKKKKELLSTSPQKREILFGRFKELFEKQIHRFAHLINTEDSTGDYLRNTKNCYNCFDVSEGWDCRNIMFGTKIKDCFNCSLLGDNSEFCYQCQSALGTYRSKFSYFTIDSSDIEYSEFSISSRNLLGCIGLRHQEYCILNKKYSRPDYEKRRQKIIEHLKKTGEWGYFLAPELSCFAYNETSAYDYLPLTKKEALAQGYRWKE